MQAPPRGMLRRPIGLLASTTTRAEAAPDAMGHPAALPRAVQCCAVLPTYTGGAEATGGGVPALPTAAIQLLSEESEGYEGLPSSDAWPFALAQPSDGPQPRIPWAALQQMPAASTASFGVASCDEHNGVALHCYFLKSSLMF